jgi:Uma2 family endonuclease
MSAPATPTIPVPTLAPAPPPVVVPAPSRVSDVPTVPIYRLSVAQYHAMIRHGILSEDDPVELLEGWLVKKMTRSPPHTFATQTLRDLVPGLLPQGWFVNDQEPVTTTESEPEPDLAVVRGTRRQFLARQPTPADLAFVVEVSDSSLGTDRGPKLRAYARAAVPVYWIVNLIDRRVEVHTQPNAQAPEPFYGQRQDYVPGDAVPVVLDGN